MTKGSGTRIGATATISFAFDAIIDDVDSLNLGDAQGRVEILVVYVDDEPRRVIMPRDITAPDRALLRAGRWVRVRGEVRTLGEKGGRFHVAEEIELLDPDPPAGTPQLRIVARRR